MCFYSFKGKSSLSAEFFLGPRLLAAGRAPGVWAGGGPLPWALHSRALRGPLIVGRTCWPRLQGRLEWLSSHPASEPTSEIFIYSFIFN